MSEITTQVSDAQTYSDTPAEAAPQTEAAPQINQRDQLLSQKFAEAAKLEREVRELRSKAKQEPTVDPEYKKWLDLKRRAKVDPMAYLKAGDLDYDMLTEYQLNGGKPVVSEEVLTIQEELAALKAERDADKKRFEEESLTKAEQAAISDIKAAVMESKDEYELLVGFGDQYSLVKSVMDESKEQGNEITAKDAAMLVEKHLEKELAPYLKIPKLQKMFAALAKPEIPTHNEEYREHSPSQSHAANTLTNSMTQSGVGTQRERSEDENRRLAASMIRFT